MIQHFKIDLGGFGRGVSDPTEGTSEADVAVWKEATRVLSNVHYNKPESTELKVDWSELVAYCEEIHRVSKLQPEQLIEYYQKYNGTRNIPKIRIDVSSENTKSTYVEHFLYQAFLALNLSCPGSFHLYNIQIPVRPDFNHEVKLGATLFEVTLLDSGDCGVIVRDDIPLESVWQWLNSVTSPTRQIAKSGIERALYGLLNLSTEEAYNPDCLMWLTHILEGLYDTSIGASFNSLRQRAISVLAIPKSKHKEFSKKLRKFYDVRSAFVHGGLDIEHPLGIDSWDQSCQEYRSILMEAIGFAMLLAVATIQTMINGNWERLTFNETWKGCEIPSCE